MPVTIATIIAVRTEAMILFHSKADISPFAPRGLLAQVFRQQTGFAALAQYNYHAAGKCTNRASCRSPPPPTRNRDANCAPQPDRHDTRADGLDPAAG